MMNNPLVSVIVPVYNVEKYLAKCIDSIVNQTLENIEIILINDGSTDSCGQIIDEYANKDKRVIPIHKKNGGQSSARNIGLDVAKGKYIGFVDSDDCVHNDMYESLYNAIETSQSDICVCGREDYLEIDGSYYKKDLENELIYINSDNIQTYIAKTLLYKHTVSLCNKIYKKNIIDENKIRFEDVSYVGSEDTLFNYCMLINTSKIKSIDKIGYTQLSRLNSTARTYKYGYMKRTSNMISCMYDYSIKTNKEKIYNNIAPIFLLFFYQWNMSNIKKVENRNINQITVSEIKDASNNPIFRKCLKELGFNINTNKYMYDMGFRTGGITLIKLVMGLYYLKRYSIATKLILLK